MIKIIKLIKIKVIQNRIASQAIQVMMKINIIETIIINMIKKYVGLNILVIILYFLYLFWNS